MRRTIGRRPLFFGTMAVLCALLVPPTPPEFRWVAWFAAGLSLFWAIMTAAEDLSTPRPDVPAEPRQRSRRGRTRA
jgi:hypothetical protein